MRCPMYCVNSMTINWRSQATTRFSSFSSIRTFMLAKPVDQAGDDFFNQGCNADG